MPHDRGPKLPAADLTRGLTTARTGDDGIRGATGCRSAPRVSARLLSTGGHGDIAPLAVHGPGSVPSHFVPGYADWMTG
jgi:hypothetical protein